ncbi:MAG: hypothetical protein HOO98_04265 [Nitrospira sp.]|nr:hypothetical protein [Nitrospira sp.]
MPVLLELFVTQRGILRLNLLKPDMTIGTVEREIFREKELEASPDMRAKTMLRLVEVAGAVDMGKEIRVSVLFQENGSRHMDVCEHNATLIPI